MPDMSGICFEHDLRKARGAYHTITGQVKRINEYQNSIVIQDDTTLYFYQLHNIDISNS